jgi:hypothetical protein
MIVPGTVQHPVCCPPQLRHHPLQRQRHQSGSLPKICGRQALPLQKA